MARHHSNKPATGASLCTARCNKKDDKKKTCGRRCCKQPKHGWVHRCLTHGNFL